ncbi:hypothetical protein ACFO4O_09685 [Glaciecola siphonariae]|uniref:Lipoprotein n=1 Tax=Glaciecola siphonariae TaxID=521012 RepID=A0ABV9LYD3_9ALTE
MKLCIISLFGLFIFACSDASFDAPACRISPKAQSEAMSNAITKVSPSKNATGACVVRLQSKLLVIERASGKYDLASSNNLSFFEHNNVAGAASSEIESMSSQCQAHRAMWLETGFNVEVGAQLAKQRDNTLLFACSLANGFDGSEVSIAAPPWADGQVQQLLYIDPFNIEQDQWHHPDNLTGVRDAYVNHGMLNAREVQ